MVNLTKYHKRTPRSRWDGSLRLHTPAAPLPEFTARCGFEGRLTTMTCPECSSRVQRVRG